MAVTMVKFPVFLLAQTLILETFHWMSHNGPFIIDLRLLGKCFILSA